MEKEGFFENNFDGDNCLNVATAHAKNFTKIQIQLYYENNSIFQSKS